MNMSFFFGVLDFYLQKNIDFRLKKKWVFRKNLQKSIFPSSFEEIVKSLLPKYPLQAFFRWACVGFQYDIYVFYKCKYAKYA